MFHISKLFRMWWLRLVGFFKLQVSFAKELYKRDDILQKRPVVLRSLLIVATPYLRDVSCKYPDAFATLCNTLQHTVTHCNTLQQTATNRNIRRPWAHFRKYLDAFAEMSPESSDIALCCSMLQCVAVCCSV